MAVGGFPVVLSDRGAPFVAVEKGAPLATLAENGRGLPIRVVDKGAPPLIIQGYNVWSPADLFENGEFGTWYDPSFLDTLFQDTSGTTPAVPGSPVGLVLDKSGNSRNLSQPTTAARPILARMPLTGRRNLWPYSQDFTQSVWVKDGTTVTPNASLAPDGTMTASRLVGEKRMYRYVVEAAPTPRVLSFYAKAEDGNSLTIGLASIAPSTTATINLDTGAVTGGAGAFSTTLRPDGYCKISIKTTSTNAQGYFSFSGVASSILIWGFQWEDGTEPTPYQRVTNAYDVTEAGVPDTYSLVYDLADDALTTTLPQAVNGDILIAGTKGSIIEPVSYAAGSTFTLGPDTCTGGTPGILRAIGDIVGVLLIDRTLTQTERDVLIEHYKGKGAKGLLVPGPELFPNPDFSDGLNSYTAAGATISLVDGNLQYIGTSFAHYVAGPAVTQVGKVYQINVLVESITRGTPLVTAGLGGSPSGELRVGDNRLYLSHLGTVGSPIIASNTEAVISLFSVRELRPQEDW